MNLLPHWFLYTLTIFIPVHLYHIPYLFLYTCTTMNPLHFYYKNNTSTVFICRVIYGQNCLGRMDQSFDWCSWPRSYTRGYIIIRTWLNYREFKPVSSCRRLWTAAIRYVLNIVYFSDMHLLSCMFIWTINIVNYVRLSFNKIKVKFIIII